MRVSQGGHDVPTAKLRAHFPRTLANLKAAIEELPCVLAYDNDDLRAPFRQLAAFSNGSSDFVAKKLPGWFKPLL